MHPFPIPLKIFAAKSTICSPHHFSSITHSNVPFIKIAIVDAICGVTYIKKPLLKKAEFFFYCKCSSDKLRESLSPAAIASLSLLCFFYIEYNYHCVSLVTKYWTNSSRSIKCIFDLLLSLLAFDAISTSKHFLTSLLNDHSKNKASKV